MTIFRRRCLLTLAVLIVFLGGAPAWGQQAPSVSLGPTPAAPVSEAAIATKAEVGADEDISRRILSIFAEIEALRGVEVQASAGVVTLSGTVPSADDIGQAKAIASRVAGVVTVQNKIKRDLKVDTNLKPAISQFAEDFRGLLNALPLIGIAFGLAALVGFLGHVIASIKRLWRWISPNAFFAEMISAIVRFCFIIAGIIAGLEVLGATALLGAVLGGAGVIGIAIGFAVRDTVDNYVSSLMLSLRQPFRANDHVVIEGHEGRVVRLTSRATILMTLDGNHLRIPNSTVFKAVILNYTRNPERRFEFSLGVDADDNPIDGMAVGLAAMKALDFVLADPRATAIIEDVGDSNILLRFFGWLDQSKTDFLKGRSFAVAAAKTALENAGFALPEPIYRLRFDEAAPLALKAMTTTVASPAARPPSKPTIEQPSQDTAPDAHVAKLVQEERSGSSADDLLDDRRPIE